jgi:hypothetical protein
MLPEWSEVFFLIQNVAALLDPRRKNMAGGLLNYAQTLKLNSAIDNKWFADASYKTSTFLKFLPSEATGQGRTIILSFIPSHHACGGAYLYEKI